jgi:uncharacterized membrane protein YbhN (UPF0104 family)
MPRRADPARLIGSVVATGLLVAWVAWRVDLRLVWTDLASTDPRWLLAAAALGPLQAALAAERWRIASDRLGRPIARGRAVREVALSVLLNQLLPGGLAGDALRAWRAGPSRAEVLPAARAVVVDRWVGLAVHLALVAAGLLAWSAAPAGAGLVTIALIGAMAAIALAPSTVRGLGPLSADLRAVLVHPPTAGAVVGLSALSTGSFLLGFALCGHALGHPLGGALWTAIPLVLLAMAVPLGFGGFGLREATAAALLPRFGVPAESAVAISAAYGLSGLLGAMPGALVPLWDR